MKWLRVCYAAVRRHQIEAPIRAMWADQIPIGTRKRARKLRYPFSIVLDDLKKKGYILVEDATVINREYIRLSNILHGHTK